MGRRTDPCAGKEPVQRNDLPLPADVGEAIAHYLRNGRPRSACRHVFCATKPRSRDSKVERIWMRHSPSPSAGWYQCPHDRAHQFRHGLASEMLHGGASLAEIGEVLGHRHVETTAIYAKVDLNTLRTLAVAWPGEVQ
ncbi:tyrosine-type recombinase/integrase [Rhizobium beringeri]